MAQNMGKFIPQNSLPPEISNRAYRQVSDYRREALQNEIYSGLFKSGTPQKEENGMTVMGNVIKGMTKTADTSSSHGSWRGSNNTIRQVSELYSPLLLHSNLNLPRDRATINAWCRAFFALNPFVHNSISLHSTYPISKLNIKCKSKKVEQFFASMIEEIDLLNVCIQIAQEYWTVGEAIVYADLDERTGKWKNLSIQNPDYILIQNSVVAGEPIISLRPDENLKRICTSNKPADVQQRQKLTQNIVDHVRRGENIPLSNFSVSHLARRISPYETRGTGLIVPAFRALMLYDRIRECKFAQTESFINPMTVVKVGGAEHKPTPQDLEMWREQFEAAQSDKDFKIFTHNEVDIQRVGAGGAIYDTTNDVNQLIKEIYVALMVPSVVMDGGSDTTYANGGVALDVLKQRYLQFRNILTHWLRRKIFAPISMFNDFYEYVDDEKILIVPDVDWNHLNLFDTDTYIQNLITLTADGRAPKHILYRSLGLDYEEVQNKLKEEAIQEIILEKEKESMKKMPLNELRALGPNDEIPELPDNPVPGEDSSSMLNESAESGGGLPGVTPPPPPSATTTPPT